jgi:large subunit ribosomal protein L25
MKQSFVIDAEARSAHGKGASRRLRREGKVPAILYGGKGEPVSIQVSHNELFKSLKLEAFYSHILTINVDGKTEQAVLKDLHRHPVRSQDIMHMDLQRVLADVLLRIRVPIHFIGEDVAPGVKTGGGVFDHLLNEIEVECLPGNLPEFIELDVSKMELNDSIHLSQLKLPEGVTAVELKHDNDEAVITLHIPKVIEEPAADAAEGAAEVPATAQKVDPKAADAAKKDDGKKK